MKKRDAYPLLLLATITLLGLVGVRLGFAENIDPYEDDSQFAYGENAGWLNAEPSGNGGPGVWVKGYKLTGYMWSENMGWVSLSCENTSSCAKVSYGVTNDGMGNLSGYAWSENAGWISFSCANKGSCATVDYGVLIDPLTRDFSGNAWGENIGWITFHSTGPIFFGITTSWPAELCEGDFDKDGDVDGLDLAPVAQGFSGVPILVIADEFGKTDCLIP